MKTIFNVFSTQPCSAWVLPLFMAPRRSSDSLGPLNHDPRPPHFLFSERTCLPARHGELAGVGFGEVDESGMVPCYQS